MRNKLIAGIVILGLFLGALFILGVIPAESNSAALEITFFDADENELGVVATQLAIFGIRGSGFEGDIYSLLVHVDFQVTTNLEYREMYSYCYLTVETAINNVQYGDIVHTVSEHQMDSGETGLSGFFEGTYLMSELLPSSAIDQYGELYGWIMSFAVRVHTTVDLDDGTQRDVEDTCGIELTLIWYEEVPEKEVLSVESWVSIP